MKIGFIGLGRMGYNMVLNLLEHNHKIVAYDMSPKPAKKLARKGAIPAKSLKEVVDKLPKPRILWIMIPAGKPVDMTINALLPNLKKGDIIIDGGNSYYKDSIKRYNKLKKKGIHFLDCGTSGGVSGARHGACMMIGGNKKVFKKVEKLFKDMCVKDGYGYMGSAGAGHFVKGVHNGIEYGMMGAIAEGAAAVAGQKKRFGTNIREAVKVYAHGSIIQSRLMAWLLKAIDEGQLQRIAGTVPKGETEDEMKELEKLADMPVLHQARLMRAKTRARPSFRGKMLAAIRNQFGGHKVIKKK